MNSRPSAFRFLAAAIAFSLCAGCGQKGPLMRPDSSPQTPVTIRPATPPPQG